MGHGIQYMSAKVQGTKVNGECCVFAPVALWPLHTSVIYDGTESEQIPRHGNLGL